jgi:hypothetical protein
MILTVPQSLQLYPPGYGGNPNQMVDVELDLSGLSGLGDCCVPTYDDTGAITNLDCSGCEPLAATPATGGAVPDTFGGTGPGSGGSITVPSTGLTPAQLTAIIQAGGTAASQALLAANGQSPYLRYNPATGTYMSASLGSTTATASLTGSMLPLMFGFVALVLVVMVIKK